jgi:hypothetical protein
VTRRQRLPVSLEAARTLLLSWPESGRFKDVQSQPGVSVSGTFTTAFSSVLSLT